MHISVPGSKSVPFKIAYWDVYLEKEILKAMQCVLWLYENQGWQKFQFEIWGAIGRHMGSTALFQSPLWNSIRPSFPDLLPSPPPWGWWSHSWRSPGCPWQHQSHARASCDCCQNRPGRQSGNSKLNLVSPGRSSLTLLGGRRLLRRQPLHFHHPA